MSIEKLIPSQPENVSLGMNSVDSPKVLGANVWQLIENAFPGLTGKPRNGMNEKMTSTSALNYGTAHGMFRPGGVYMKAGSKDFIFTLTRCVTANHTDEYQLEVWNLTDSTRTVVEAFQSAATVTYFGFTKLYNALYFVMDQAITTNRTSAYRTLPAKIIEYVGTTWTVREMGITPAPAINVIQTGDAVIANFSINLSSHTSVVYKNKLWIIGGYDGASLSKKVFYSSDGIIWTEAGTNSLPVGLWYHTSLIFNNKMWVIGGALDASGPTSASKKVYSSSDGVTWIEAGTDALPVALYGHSSVVFNNKIWVAGGTPVSYSASRKIYSSSDGITWVESGTNSLPVGLYGFGLLVLGSKMWTIGGYNSTWLRKVYSSSDGITWTEVGTDALPVGTAIAAYLVYNSKLWLIGGTTPSSNAIRKVYSSSDGITWTEVGTDALPVGKSASSSVYFNNRLWVICGGNPILNTIYSSSDGTIWTQAIGGITANLYTDIAFTFVKLASTLTGNQGVFTEPIIESIEDVSQRQSVKMLCSTATGTLLIPMPPTAQAIAQGATHLRVWRTLGNADATVAAGLEHLYICDIALTNAADSIYYDITTDTSLEGESNSLNVTGYEVPPAGRFSIFASGRLIIGGNPSNPGYWFGSMLPQNTASPQKYSSLFSTRTLYITCDPYDGQADTGCALVGGDLLLFKERKIFVLDNADFNNVPRKISSTIGCCCPDTIQLADIPALGGQCVLFISESGPAIILPGFVVRLLTEFRTAELWPLKGKAGIQLLANGTATTAYSRNKVASAFYDNTWWILYGDSTDTDSQLNTPKCFGFTFANEDTSIGPFSVTVPQYVTGGNSYTIFEPQLLVPIDNLRAIAFSHKVTAAAAVKYRAVQWLDAAKWQDTYLVEGAISYSMAFRTRYLVAASTWYGTGILDMVIVRLYFQDGSGLTITAYADGTRLVSPCTYTQIRQSGNVADNTFRHYVIALPQPDMRGNFFDVLISKVVPSTGAVEFFGVDLGIRDVQNDIKEEFISASSALTGSIVEVEKVDANPEVPITP